MPYLPEQLDSVLSQTRLPDEIVICDDGSTDGSWEYLRSRANSHRSIRLERNNKNLGSTKNFERAIGACTGDIIFLSDQDDLWHPEKIELQSRHMETTGAALVMSNADLVTAEGLPLHLSLWQANKIRGGIRNRLESAEAWRVLIRRRHITGAACCINRAICQSIMPIPSMVWHDAWIATALAILEPGQIRLLDRKLFRYRQHGKNQIGAGVNLTLHALIRRGDELRTKIRRELRDQSDLERNLALFHHLSIFALTRGSEASRALIGKHLNAARRHITNRLAFATGVSSLGSIFAPEVWLAYWRYSNGAGSMIRDLLSGALRGEGRKFWGRPPD